MVISTDMMLEMVPRWDKTGRGLHDDPVASEAMGWIRDMYAIALAMANNPTGPDMLVDSCLMAQPPVYGMVIDTKVVRTPCVHLRTILILCVIHRVLPCPNDIAHSDVAKMRVPTVGWTTNLLASHLCFGANRSD